MAKKYLQTLYSQVPTVYHKEITKTEFNVPSWYFAQTKCDVCKNEIRRLVAHGMHNATCTLLQVNGYDPMPLHDECYNEKFASDNPDNDAIAKEFHEFIKLNENRFLSLSDIKQKFRKICPEYKG